MKGLDRPSKREEDGGSEAKVEYTKEVIQQTEVTARIDKSQVRLANTTDTSLSSCFIFFYFFSSFIFFHFVAPTKIIIGTVNSRPQPVHNLLPYFFSSFFISLLLLFWFSSLIFILGFTTSSLTSGTTGTILFLSFIAPLFFSLRFTDTLLHL